MARQKTTPVVYQKTSRIDKAVAVTSGRAAQVIPMAYMPILRGDSASGRVSVQIDMAEMPKPLLNGVFMNVQAWFVPKSVHPQFSGTDEFMNSYQNETIKALGQADREPPAFFDTITDPADITLVQGSHLYKTLGIHIPADTPVNTDLIDAFVLVHNFRLAANSTRLPLAEYAQQDLAAAVGPKRAFWHSNRFSRVVPDYERALVVGSLDLDIFAGTIPIDGLFRNTAINAEVTDPVGVNDGTDTIPSADSRHVLIDNTAAFPRVFAEMENTNIVTSLADIDKARTTQAFAKLRTSMAGNDNTGFNSDDAIVATMMQGLSVPPEMFHRPWLMDSARVALGFNERHASDGDSLDKSVSKGRATASLSLNLPQQDSGGTIVVICEVLPERINEAQSDEWLLMTDVEMLPDALRDIQRTEPTDMVLTRRLDTRHTTPAEAYGWEGMNDKWNRDYTKLGGVFFQDDPSNPWKEQRAAIWQTEIIDPQLDTEHYLAPADFPHDVFSDPLAPAFEAVVRHNVTVVGLTQLGDALDENNDEYADTKSDT